MALMVVMVWFMVGCLTAYLNMSLVEQLLFGMEQVLENLIVQPLVVMVQLKY